MDGYPPLCAGGRCPVRKASAISASISSHWKNWLASWAWALPLKTCPTSRKSAFAAKAEELCALVDAFNNPLVGCCWDTGHGMISGDDQYEALTLLGHRVKALHIDDNYGTARDVHLLPYEGLIDWSKVMRALREIGYDHDFAFEHALNPTPHAVMPAQLRYMCALGREMLSNM